MNEEPSLLDYIKSKLRFWVTAPAMPEEKQPALPVEPQAETGEPLLPSPPLEVLPPPPPPRPRRPFPWRMLLAFGLGLFAQITLAPHRDWKVGLFLYFLAWGWLVLANFKGEWQPFLSPEVQLPPQPLTVRWGFVLAGTIFSLLAYQAFGGALFNRTNLFEWAVALISFMCAFWIASPGGMRRLWERVWGWLRKPYIRIGAWGLLLIAVALISIYFRFYLINEVPSQMNSDHAEKLLDVWDVLHGYTRVFFPRNTGREAFQFHLIAATVLIFKTGVSFLSMKLGAITFGLLTLPFIYLIGVEIGNRWVGFWATLFAGIAYWPNVFSRLALRFTFYPFFAAPTLYFLIRGLRRQSRNDLIVSGLLLGLGLHSYTPIRILPVVVVVGVGLYVIHQRSWRVWRQSIFGLAVITLLAVVGFIPLLRYIANPINREMFFYRSLTRVGTVEQPLPGPAWKILIGNTWNAMRMFGWDGGDVWTVSVPHRPALDVVTAALCYLGMGLLFVRYLRKHNWVDLFLLLSVPMLMLPSILSLAFPNENPVLSRTSGAIIPVFVMVGIAMESLLSTLKERMDGARVGAGVLVAGGLGVVLFLLSANANYDLVFNQYRKGYDLSSWNSSEMGAVYKDFATSIGTRDTFWLVGYPYWVDSRLVSIVAGFPDRDCAITPDALADTQAELRAKLFILHPQDTVSLNVLQQLYPTGTTQLYKSKYETKDFVMFFVPPSQ